MKSTNPNRRMTGTRKTAKPLPRKGTAAMKKGKPVKNKRVKGKVVRGRKLPDIETNIIDRRRK